MLRILPGCWLLIALAWPALLAGAEPPAQPAPPQTEIGEPGFQDDPLGHVRPGVGGQIEAAIRLSELGEEAAHQGLFGDALHSCGPFDFEYLYTGELLSNTRGGITTRRATQYDALLDVAMLFDPADTCLPLPGRFFMLMQNTHGRGLTQDFVGDAQVLSNIDSFENIMQVSEYWWEMDLCHERLTLRLGKQDVNGEFLVVDVAGDFLQSSFGISPHLGVPTYPDPSAAAVVLAQLSPAVELKVGIWDGVPDGGNWGFSGTGITFTIGEIEYTYSLCGGLLPGKVDVGVAYVSAGEISPGEYLPQNYGYHVDFEQTLFRENPYDDGDDQGLSVFFQHGAAYPPGDVAFRSYFGGGLVYKGPLPRRGEDIVGAGVAHSEFDEPVGTGHETAVEVFYKAHLTPWMTVQPDLQYIASPSGIYPDSLVAGCRYQVVF